MQTKTILLKLKAEGRRTMKYNGLLIILYSNLISLCHHLELTPSLTKHLYLQKTQTNKQKTSYENTIT